MYTNNGWINKSSTLIRKDNKHIGKLCEVCHDKILKLDKVISLKCTHYFHRDCWHETLKQHLSTANASTGTSSGNTIIACPTCRKNYYIYEVV